MFNIYPRKTEKSYGLSKDNVYVFDVPASANKQQIKTEVEKQFNVKVINIKTLVQFGKIIHYSKGKRSRPGETSHSNFKKAYVTLAKGNSIKVFDEATESETPSKTKTKENK